MRRNLNMKRLLFKLSVCVALLIGIACLFATAGFAEEVAATLEIRPDTLTGPGNVTVNINVSNTSDGSSPISVTLYDPSNTVVNGFGSGGTAHLNPGESQSYTGSWQVTQDQFEKGKLTYTVKYTTTNASGEKVQTSRPFGKTFKKNTAKVGFDVERIHPESPVVEGQTVKITYKMTNTGTVDISNIIIKDPDITKESLKLALLKPGETQELSASYIAGTSSKTSQCTINYDVMENGKTSTKKYESEVKVIDVTIPDIKAELKVSKSIVNAGDKVELTCVITNRSDLSYSQIKVTDALLGDIDQDLQVGAGKSKTVNKSTIVDKNQRFQFTIEAMDSTGTLEVFQSNEVVVQTVQDQVSIDSVELVPVNLNVLLEADRPVLYDQPSEIIFHVKVVNNGAVAVQNVEISDGKKIIKTIPKIEPGETIDFTKLLMASVGGQFQFTATTKNTRGEKTSAQSNILQIPFTPTRPPVTMPPPPTDPPTAPPAATTPPATTPPIGGSEDSSGGGGGAGTILLYVLAGLLVVILGAVGSLFYLDHKRNNPAAAASHGGQNVVIDSLQRNPHRDYARAPKRSRSESRAPKKAEKSIVPTYAPDDDMLGGGAEQPEPAFEKAGQSARSDSESPYRRPKPESTPRHPAPEAQTSDALSQTEIFSRDYLTRIRRGANESEQPAEPSERPPLSAEDTALLSGSTGQYRLSRRSASVRTPQEAATSAKKFEGKGEIKSPPRADKAKDIMSFYEDEEDEGPVKPRRH